MSTPFEFLRADFPDLHRGAVMAGSAALRDPRTACFHARWTIEQAIKWAYAHDRSLPTPYDEGVSALLHEPSFKGPARRHGVQDGQGGRSASATGRRTTRRPLEPARLRGGGVAPVPVLLLVRPHLRRRTKPPADLTFDPRTLPKPGPSPAATTAQIQELQQALEESELARQRVQDELVDRAKLEAELERLRAEVAEAKAKAAATPDEHDYSEAETRDYFLDLLLAEAGWTLDQPRDREFEVTGMPTEQGIGYVDYVLWGDDGKPLAVVEAKRTRRDARVGQQQAKLYADCLEQMFGQRPVIFYSNGYEHWIWDDQLLPAPPGRRASSRGTSWSC